MPANMKYKINGTIFEIQTSAPKFLFNESSSLMFKGGDGKGLFEEVVTLLAKSGTLPSQYRPHKLSGEWKGF